MTQMQWTGPDMGSPLPASRGCEQALSSTYRDSHHLLPIDRADGDDEDHRAPPVSTWEASLDMAWVVRVNRDWVIHLGRWRRLRVTGIPSEVAAEVDKAARRVVLRAPGLGGQLPAGVALAVHETPVRVCVYLRLLEKIGATVGADLSVVATPTTMTLWRR